MKKILLIISLFFMSSLVVNAQTDKFYLYELYDDYVYAKQGDVDKYTRMGIMKSKSTNEIVYCLNPLILLNEEGIYEGYNYNNKIFNISNEVLDKINLASYYGYGYNGHEGSEWYKATQMLIWKYLGIDEVYFVDGFKGSKVDRYTREMDEINKLVEDYYIKPSFNNKNLKVSTNTTGTTMDDFRVSKNYEVINYKDNFKTSDRGLSFETKNLKGKYTLELEKTSPVNKDYVLYYNSVGQSLILPGRINTIKASVTYNVIEGSIELKKTDSKNNALLKGAKYGIYDYNNNLVDTIITNDNGIGKVSNLQLGGYTLKEIEAPLGYLKDNKSYKINIDIFKPVYSLSVVDDIIKAKVIINKFNGEDIDNNSCFTINGKEYKTTNGSIELELEYGTYKVVHTCGYEEYSKIPDFTIEVLDTDELTYNLTSNKIVINNITTKEENISSNKVVQNINEEKRKDIKVEKVSVPNTHKDDINLSFIGIIFMIVGSFIIKKATI